MKSSIRRCYRSNIGDRNVASWMQNMTVITILLLFDVTGHHNVVIALVPVLFVSFSSSSTRCMATTKPTPPSDFTILDDENNNNNDDNDKTSSNNVRIETNIKPGEMKDDDDWYEESTNKNTNRPIRLRKSYDTNFRSDENNNNENMNQISEDRIAPRRSTSWMDRNVQFSDQQSADQYNNNKEERRGGTFRQQRPDTFRKETTSSRTNNNSRRFDNTKQNERSSYNRNSRNNNDRTDQQQSQQPRNFRQDFRGTRVFVQGLPPSATWQTLKDHFRLIPDSNVIFASVSIDPNTGQSKGYGIVQYETYEMAQNAIQQMRDYPMDGYQLYIREDVQENTNNSNSSNKDNIDSGKRIFNKNNEDEIYNKKGPTPPTKWKCANDEDDITNYIEHNDYNSILQILKARDQARRRKNYNAADAMREQLKYEYNVQIDDRLEMWWINTNRNNNNNEMNRPPLSIQQIKGEGGWDRKPSEWKQIPTTIEYDACVDPDLIMGLLKQRDIARREKDFKTADMLLEQARNAPDGDLSLRIHDESRTWRIWTDTPPPKSALHRSSLSRVHNQQEDDDDDEEEDDDNKYENNNNDRNIKNNKYPTSSDGSTGKTPAEQCMMLVEELAPEKREEVQQLLEKFPGREWNILKKLKQRYSR
jgi:RNA recognition motif. (a.k.a. RRM, RBD, or RNP domain)